MAAGTLSVTSFLPDLQLPAAADGNLVRLREMGGKITAVFGVHSAECEGCREYLDGLRPIAEEFRDWDARLLVIVPGEAGVGELPTFGRVLLDRSRRIADGASASLLVADRYGQIFEAVRAGASHELPSARELAEWLKYLGTLCPE